jgi:hypothetical protein
MAHGFFYITESCRSAEVQNAEARAAGDPSLGPHPIPIPSGEGLVRSHHNQKHNPAVRRSEATDEFISVNSQPAVKGPRRGYSFWRPSHSGRNSTIRSTANSTSTQLVIRSIPQDCSIVAADREQLIECPSSNTPLLPSSWVYGESIENLRRTRSTTIQYKQPLTFGGVRKSNKLYAHLSTAHRVHFHFIFSNCKNLKKIRPTCEIL